MQMMCIITFKMIEQSLIRIFYSNVYYILVELPLYDNLLMQISRIHMRLVHHKRLV